MKEYEILDDTTMDVEDWQVERALQKAAIDAIRRARQFGTEYVIWEDGQMKCLKPHETEEYERRALANLDQINARIAELQARQPREHAALVLKEDPPKPEKTD
jgi:hypothetical protein